MRRLSLSASRIAAACGGASAASSPIAFSVWGNLSSRNRTSVSSSASARAAPEMRRDARSARTLSAKVSAPWRKSRSNREFAGIQGFPVDFHAHARALIRPAAPATFSRVREKVAGALSRTRERAGVSVSLRSAAALARLDVEVAAGHRLSPIGDQVARAFEIGRPFLGDDGSRGLPDRVELAVGLDLADIDRLGDVMVP